MHQAKLPPNIPIVLDGRRVEKITAFLFDKGGNDDPHKLKANEGKSFQGSIVLGMGFTFDDTNPEATPIAEMHRLIEQNPKNAEVIFPYIGGEEVNSSPTHAHHRYVINFGEMTEEEVRKNYPDLMAIVEEKVKPQRARDKRASYRNRWWQFAEKQISMQKAIEGYDRVLVAACGASKWFAPAFLTANCVFSNTLVVFALDKYSHFTVLQSTTHEIWARFLGSSMKDDLRYTPSDCFENFPFPANWENDRDLEAIGKTYYEYRAALMIRNNQGLTDTYNRFHDPHEDDPDILHLRTLHDQMDRAVLHAYGWSDIENHCGFALDYLDIDTEDLPPQAQERIESGDLFFATPEEAVAFDVLIRSKKTKRGKLPWGYKWSSVIHDEVLARLLDLNQERYEAEVRLGLHQKRSGRSEANTLDLTIG